MNLTPFLLIAHIIALPLPAFFVAEFPAQFAEQSDSFSDRLMPFSPLLELICF